jgi:hypothetical protein
MGERVAQPAQIARRGHAQEHARAQPLEIVDVLELVARLAAQRRSVDQELDGVLAPADGRDRGERIEQPAPEQPPPLAVRV